MAETRVKIQTILESQLPEYLVEEAPLLVEFLKQYYISQEYQSGPADIVQNIDKYLKLEENSETKEFTYLSDDITSYDTEIPASALGVGGLISTFTQGFPDEYGLLLIDNEIITYERRSQYAFEGCKRGFSGVKSYRKDSTPDELEFSESSAASHKREALIYNLSAKFLTEFFTKVKRQFIPGLSDRELASGLNQRSFVANAKDFYESKGTDDSFKILFGALYGERVDVIKPREYLFRPSDAGYRTTKDLVVEALEGNPLDLLNNTLYQDAYPEYGIENSYASITDVQKIFEDGKEFYKLSFDADYDKDLTLEGTLYGNFVVHPKTRVITSTNSGDTILDVDSTVGFGTTGTLVTKSSSSADVSIAYTGRSVTQFYNIVGLTTTVSSGTDVRLDVFAYGYSGITTENPIKVRIGSVLDEVNILGDTTLFTDNDTAKIKTLGISSETIRRNNWIYNIANSYDVLSFTLRDRSNFTYDVELHDDHIFYLGDKIKLTDSTSETENSTVVDILGPRRISIRGQGELDSDLTYSIDRDICKPNSTQYGDIVNNTANIQNVYTDYSDNVLVASPSIPFYYNQVLEPNNKKVTFSGTFSGEQIKIISRKDHGFYTGDKVYYTPNQTTSTLLDDDGEVIEVTKTINSKLDGLDEGLYYVKRVSSTTISLAKSPSNLNSGVFITVTGTVTDNVIEFYDFRNKELEIQNIVREFKPPVNKSETFETKPGRTGIFINGVEILNYKSSETVFYGEISSVDVAAPGFGYDVINPPSLHISDSQGIGATGTCAITGALERIEIVDTGFDYVNKPFVVITGGEGKGASAEVNTTNVEHSVTFNSESSSSDLNIFTDTIGFSTYHKFRENERVIYLSDGQEGIAGLGTGSSYYVRLIDGFSVKLHANEDDAIAGINTVNIDDYGVGIHRLKSAEGKDIITDIVVTNPGEGYKNKERVATTAGINTALSSVNILSHGYETGEEITYSTTGTAVSGLTTTTNYLVKKVSDDSFKLAPVGLGTIAKTYYLDTEQYAELDSIGTGDHKFNYTPITVSIVGNVGVSTLAGQDFSAKIQPVFRGSIDSVQVTAKGSEYGSDTTINYNRQPQFHFRSGNAAQLIPIINRGVIQEVLVVRGGSGFNSPPDLVIKGNGNYCKLTPIIDGGELKEVKVINGGIGYDDTTTIEAVGAGQNGRLLANIQRWTVNNFQKYFNIISNDDGIITEANRSDKGLQYCHLYAPRKLRESVYARSQSSGSADIKDLILYGISDLRKVNSEETTSTSHSPIIGWAYDGNPIYGPYGFSEPNGGTAKLMESGYESVTKTNRPPVSNFPQGFFNEDFEYKGNGDLDEHNGRFCVTPDYPNGTYAYFSTINPGDVDTDGPFKNYKRPVFPYLIGPTFQSEPNAFNFSKESNQDEYEFTGFKWFRNTTNYQLTSSNSSYKYVFEPYDIKEQNVNIEYVTRGSVDSIGITTGGDGYQVNDRLKFDNSLTGGKNASARVEKVFGKKVLSVSAATTSFTSVEFATIDGVGNVIGFTTSPHGLKNLELVNVSGLNTSFSKIEGSYSLGIRTDNFVTTLGIGSVGVTGLTTFFYVSGILEYPYVRENDILGIGTQEKVKVLNVDPDAGRLRVLREYESTVSSAYTATSVLYEDPRKFRINTGFRTDYAYNVNRELYFDPSESVGIGTTTAVGIGTTIVFSVPGAGSTQVFVPSQSIFLPKHNIKTGDKVRYSTHGGSEIRVSNGSTSFSLSQTEDLFAASITNDFIGISTVKVGLSSEGSFVGIGTTNSAGLLFFESFGSGVQHSFTTKNDSIVGEVSKNIITVATGSTHGLLTGDTVELSNIVSAASTITVKYNDNNRRAVFNPKDFTASDVSASEDTIRILDHNLVFGDKVIYTSASPSGGLENEKIYYVLPFTKDKVRLCATKYDLELADPNYVNITSTSSGTLSPVNPQLNLYKNNSVKFDVSDSSLSAINGSTVYSAFQLNFYTDSNNHYEFTATGTSKNFEVVRTGRVGIDTSASVTLLVNDHFPENIYYNLENDNVDFISEVKKEIVTDTEVYNHSQVNFVDSKYSGTHRVTGIGTTNTFTFDLKEYPEKDSYDRIDAGISYQTTSPTAFGAISLVKVINGGSNYEIAPGVSTVTTSYGSDAIFDINTNTIGNIVKTKVEDIGFDYPSDPTLSPSLNLPEILKIDPLSSFESIGISSAGKGYFNPPTLVVIDSFTKKRIEDVDIRYIVGEPEVKIVKNTYGIHNALPDIIPTANPNGVGINTISYNSSTKDVVVGFNTGFSDAFPFAVGDKVLVENTSVGVGSTARGYNSSAYDYQLFELTEVNPALGGVTGSVTFNLASLLEPNEFPGIPDNSVTSGRIVNKNDFPVFDITLRKNDYFVGETVVSERGSGVVESWNPKTEYLKVSTNRDIPLGDYLAGQTSNTRGIVKEKTDFDSFLTLNSTAKVNKGWIYDTGMLNNNIQRIADNDYYQYFSYSLKSRVDYGTWEEPVQTLNHTSGFLKFSDLVLENADGDRTHANVFGDDSVASLTVDLVGSGNINCFHVFDLASEKTTDIGAGGIISNEIVFENRTLTDFFESVGNRVLIIDDFSDQFNSNPRATRFSIVDEFDITAARYLKYFTFVRDRRFNNERQTMIVSLLHDDSNSYINQYGRLSTLQELGDFDFSISGTTGQLAFYPIKFSVNNYDINHIVHDLKDTVVGVGNTALGSVVHVGSAQTTLASGETAATTIVSMANTYRSAKILVEIGGVDGSYYEVDEISLLHDGTDVDILEYGQMTNEISSADGTAGLGTYIPYIDGSDVKIDFKPNAALGVGVTINSLLIQMSSDGTTGIGTQELNDGLVSSGIASISSSATPTEHVITEYPNSHSAAYYVVSIEDTTNTEYEFYEVIVIDDGTSASITEFAAMRTNSTLGTVGAAVTTNGTQITFTPEANIDVQVRVFQNALRVTSVTNLDSSIDFNNAEITGGSALYEGTNTSVKRSFDLTHNELMIFQRYFLGDDSDIVSVSNNTITVPDHFFVTGEELTYTFAGAGTTQAISIASTSVPGIGLTDKLPSTVYAVKSNESTLQFAPTAEDALKGTPNTFDITAVGIGTSHCLIAKNQNTKNVLAIDNYIQSPIVGTSQTVSLVEAIDTGDNRLKFSGITSFFGGNLIQVDDEIMKINTVGLGSTNIVLVDRPWMGTGLADHSANAEIKLVEGNYNIVNNTIHFVDAPFGLTPIGTTTNEDPNERDWLGIATHSTFQGRTFLRSGKQNTDQETYTTNYVFDGLSNQFTGIAKTFTLQSDGQDVAGFSTNNGVLLVNGVFQGPQGAQAITQDYTLGESAGITSVTFTGTATSAAYDVNNANIPVGGVIVSVGSSEGFGLQPLVAAGGTAVVSAAGTISSISIGNTGSGYRIGIQTVVNVGVQTSSTGTPNIEFIGTASVSNGHIIGVAITNPGAGYTSSNPPAVVFDDPLSYNDLDLHYSSTSSPGIGTQAKVDIVVGQGSSVIDFTLSNTGYGYGQGEILTVEIGGNSGIPTDTSKPYLEFNLEIERTYSDFFSGWTLGQFQVLDTYNELFNGRDRKFPLKVSGSAITIRAKKGSNIDIQATLLVFINDILQKPGEAYKFKGGSIIEFTEAPKKGDIVKTIFYKGSGDIDVIFRDILETVKVGDTLTLQNEPGFGQGPGLMQDSRTVIGINTTDSVETNPYSGPGITTDDTLLRPIKWCKQTREKVINGIVVGKDRVHYEPNIHPSSYLISSVGIGSTVAYVDNLRPFFNPQNESPLLSFQNKVVVTSQNVISGASGTAIVSSTGDISSIDITDGGLGYNSAPNVIIQTPVGIGTTQKAEATSTLTSGSVSAITITSAGTGYTTSQPPAVMIEPPTLLSETVEATYEGDSGVIVGVGTTTRQNIFDLFIPGDSFMRDTTVVGSAVTISGISTGDFFILYDTNIGLANTSINSFDSSNQLIGVGTQFLDNVYQVNSYEDIVVDVTGIGNTHVRRVYVNTGISTVDFSYDTITFDSTNFKFSSVGFGTGAGSFQGMQTSNYFGNFSWGKISFGKPLANGSFNAYTSGGIGGISTSALINRFAPLKFNNYTS